MNLTELLSSLTKIDCLRFLLIGGHAVVAHGYARTTFDVDILVEKNQLGAWTQALAGLGYSLAQQAPGFAQFTPPPSSPPLDLMIVGDASFKGILEQANTTRIGELTVKIPSIDHLLALKLHVLKQDLSHRVVKDLDDVIQLVLINRLPIETKHYQDLFERYGTPRDYKRVLRATRT